MKRRYKLTALALALLLLLPLVTACKNEDAYKGEGYTFTDSTGRAVTLPEKPQRVAVLFSSLADIWIAAGGTVTMTVEESVERGLVASGVTILAAGAGKAVDAEAVIAAAPDLVLFSADVAGHITCAELVRLAGIPTALLRVESFSDYLTALKIFTDINERPDLYESAGLAQKERIDEMIAEQPLVGKRILFARATATTVKAKSSDDHFAAAMLRELGAQNIADSAPLLLDGLNVETVLAEDPDYLFFSAMGSEEAAAAAVDELLSGQIWGSLNAVKGNRYALLPRDTFHYKPNTKWADAYAYLIELLK